MPIPRSARSVATMVAPAVAPPSVAWKIVVLFATGGRSVMSEGRKVYDPKQDVIVEPIRVACPDARKVSVSLGNDFVMSVAVSKQVQVDGFGLFISRRGNAQGFSWEWFDRFSERLFHKRQGNSRMAVTIQKSFGYQELESIEFLDDVALRYLDDITQPPGMHTHEVIIRAGSVFKLTA